MSTNDDWTLLRTFKSEVEARVVESFLRAQGFEVQLFDVHTNSMPALRPAMDGMRLMVRASFVAEAEAVLTAAQRPSHLEIVGEELPVARSRFEFWMVWLLVVLAGTVFLLLRLEL